MTTVALLSEKGGVGKSTLAVHIAAELEARGNSVAVLDSDPQGTAIGWAMTADEHGLDHPTVVAVTNVVNVDVEGADWIVIDSPGRAAEALRASLMVADLALVVVRPASADVWALARTLDVVASAQTINKQLVVGLVINQIRRTSLASSAIEAIEQLKVPILGRLGLRSAFEEAFALGRGVAQYSGGLAAVELRRLVDRVEGAT